MITLLSGKKVTLSEGKHKNPEDGLCVMEAAAYIAGEPHSDHPQCVSAVISDYMIYLNDRTTISREDLEKAIPKILNTSRDAIGERQLAVKLFRYILHDHLPETCSLRNQHHVRAMKAFKPTASLEDIQWFLQGLEGCNAVYGMYKSVIMLQGDIHPQQSRQALFQMFKAIDRRKTISLLSFIDELIK